jgi:3'-5' exoribonuclease
MTDGIKKSTIYARVKGVNTSDSMFNATVELADSTIMNLKTNQELNLKQGYIYQFEIAQNTNSERLVAFLISATRVSDLADLNLVDNVYRSFDKRNPVELKTLISEIDEYINRIDNVVLKDITKKLIEDNKSSFFTYPAATRMHHAYVGGLAYHTLGMLHLADGFLDNYKYLSKDYLYSGIILHDLGKIIEFSGVENTEYAKEGQLLGHLVIGGLFVSDAAKELGYQNKEEVLILEHMIISHHGQPNFGACKKPQTAEAEVLWYIDTLDSKLRVLGEELEHTNSGEFTDVIGVLEKTKFYKHN